MGWQMADGGRLGSSLSSAIRYPSSLLQRTPQSYLSALIGSTFEARSAGR